ncbi:MAG: HNH endonuclease [Thermoleophilaceae bacterium]
MPSRRFATKARVALLLAARGRCSECGAELRRGWHADHVTPLAAGGRTVAANGQALCPACNLSKGGRAG